MRKAIVAGVGLGLGWALVSCGQAGPGVAIDWGKNAAPPRAAHGSVSLATASPAQPSPTTESAGIWTGLNQNTAEVARGEYLLIQQLEHALELQITGMLPRR